MKKHFSILAAAALALVLAVATTSCKKGENGSSSSPKSIKDYYRTVWVSNADMVYVLSFGDEVTLPRFSITTYGGYIKSQFILKLHELAHPGQISFEILNPVELPCEGVCPEYYYYTLELTGDKSAVLYVCDEDWNHGDDGTSFELRPDFDLTSLKFHDEYVPAAVDLGEMKTSDGREVHVKWAEWNLGAHGSYIGGLFYCWGELFQKTTCFPGNYLYWDEPDVLPADKDAATIWLGAPWRMPVKDELEALFNTKNDGTNFLWAYEKLGDRYCWRVTRKTGACAGNSIVLPLAGYCGSDGKDGADAVAYFWSSSIDPRVYPHTPTISLDKRYAYFMCFFAGGGSSPVFNTIDRYTGLSIRPVCDL